MKKGNIVLLGGDLRQYYMAKSLLKRGFAISYYGILFPVELSGGKYCRKKEELWKQIEESEAVILPVPCTRDGKYINSNSLADETIKMDEIVEHLWYGQKLFGGDFSEFFYGNLLKKYIEIFDFTKEPIHRTKKRALIAEEVLLEAMLLSEEAIVQSESLILGFGNVGKILAKRLRGMGSEVAIATEEETEREQAIKEGYPLLTYPILWNEVKNRKFVFLTETMCIGRVEELQVFAPETIVLDVTGRKGMVDYGQIEKMGILVKICSPYPGKYTSKSTGEMMADYVCEQLSKPRMS